tara:strand:+ start:652 stop:1035 length:384 start_codon:yes stop_codon:yes gene_type:complete
MALESKLTEQQLFDQLISSLVHTTWVSLGKIKNPMTDKIEKDIVSASINIDMIDMLYKRMDGNLSDAEDEYLSQVLSELKMNYIHEKSQIPETESEGQEASEEYKTNNKSGENAEKKDSETEKEKKK